MAVGAEVGGHGFDRREVDNAVSGMGFFASPPCPHAPAFFYVPRAAASAAASTERDVTFACNGDYGAVAGTPAPPTKRAREEGRLRFPGADGRAKKRKVDVDPVVDNCAPGPICQNQTNGDTDASRILEPFRRRRERKRPAAAVQRRPSPERRAATTERHPSADRRPSAERRAAAINRRATAVLSAVSQPSTAMPPPSAVMTPSGNVDVYDGSTS
uniref:Uncharacterized protein n=1 Tax=Oryza brachyantha TaxID=4533 RepID=J3LRT5_ORYBR